MIKCTEYWCGEIKCTEYWLKVNLINYAKIVKNLTFMWGAILTPQYILYSGLGPCIQCFQILSYVSKLISKYKFSVDIDNIFSYTNPCFDYPSTLFVFVTLAGLKLFYCVHSTTTNITKANCCAGRIKWNKTISLSRNYPQIQEWLWKWICVNNCLASWSLMA